MGKLKQPGHTNLASTGAEDAKNADTNGTNVDSFKEKQ